MKYLIAPNDILLGKKRNLNQKESEKKKIKKKSKADENIIKRIKKYRNLEEEEKLHQFKKDDEITKQKKSYDLWGSDNNATSKKKAREIQYPKVPLPHPGQSYNPSRKDLKNLLVKVVENNRPVEIEKKTSEFEEREFQESRDEEKSVDPN